jgi:hypothetical protein
LKIQGHSISGSDGLFSWRRQQSVPHLGLREALLAPMAAPALPDAVRSVIRDREEKELTPSPKTQLANSRFSP